jgi:hypothetical protein
LELDGCHLSTETQKQPMLFSSLAKNPGCRIHHVMVETLRLLEKWTLQSLVLMRKDFLLLYQGLEIAIHCCLSSKHMSEAEKWNFSILGEFIPKNIIGDKGGYDTLQTERYQRQKTKQRLPKTNKRPYNNHNACHEDRFSQRACNLIHENFEVRGIIDLVSSSGQ